MEKRSTTFLTQMSTSLGDLLLDSYFGAFLTVGSALECAGTLVNDYTIGSKLQHGAASLPNPETGSLEYRNSPLESDNSALEYINSVLDCFESTSLGDLLRTCDFGAFLKIGSALERAGTSVKD